MSSVERVFLQLLLWAVAQRALESRPGGVAGPGLASLTGTAGVAGTPGATPGGGTVREGGGSRAGGGSSAMGRFRALFEEAARRYGLDPRLLWAVARAESGLNPAAVSPAGAVGLMQLMPSTARALGVSDPFDPVQNVDAGARYLRQQLERFGDIRLALAAYNAGPGAVQRYGGIPPYRETRQYVERVLALWREAGGGVSLSG
ncbi:MAG: lytic transglycosylase domain-containing protein [Symbiobacteriaceae bacterium]